MRSPAGRKGADQAQLRHLHVGDLGSAVAAVVVVVIVAAVAPPRRELDRVPGRSALEVSDDLLRVAHVEDGLGLADVADGAGRDLLDGNRRLRGSIDL